MISLWRIKTIILLLFIHVTVAEIAAQQTITEIDKIYGSDPLLYNGKVYIFYPPINTGGNQFLSDRQFETGSVTLRGVTFNDRLLNYDIYNQQLILKCKTNAGFANQIIISDAWLETFTFKGLKFKIISTQDTLKRIYQVLGTGPDYILYYWMKNLKLDSYFGATNHTFSKAIKEKYIFLEGQILKYRNNKSFYSLFAPENRIAVKAFLRKKNIRVSKASDQLMTELINYCNTMINK
jgi:hypothetical protein